MREWSLVSFTLLSQLAVGLFWAVGLATCHGGPAWFFPIVPYLVVGSLGLAAALTSLLHLGSPWNAWRAVRNLRSSWLSREILFLGLLGGGWAVMGLLYIPGSSEPPVTALSAGSISGHAVLTGAVALTGAGFIYSMARVYRLRTVPTWSTGLTTADFFLTAGALGGLVGALLLAATTPDAAGAARWSMRAPLAMAGLSLALAVALESRWHSLRSSMRQLIDAGLFPWVINQQAAGVHHPSQVAASGHSPDDDAPRCASDAAAPGNGGDAGLPGHDLDVAAAGYSPHAAMPGHACYAAAPGNGGDAGLPPGYRTRPRLLAVSLVLCLVSLATWPAATGTPAAQSAAILSLAAAAVALGLTAAAAVIGRVAFFHYYARQGV